MDTLINTLHAAAGTILVLLQHIESSAEPSDEFTLAANGLASDLMKMAGNLRAHDDDALGSEHQH